MKRVGWPIMLLGAVLVHQGVWAEGHPVATISVSGESVDLEAPAGGRTVIMSLPLYRSAGVRYFSAGVGLEERSAEYPPFPLKIVFTAGGKPFLSGVAVTIQPANAGAIAIPREQVEGPWLFVDLSPGLYDVTATFGDQTQHLKGIRVESGKQKVVYLRWKDDRNTAATAIAE
ncbi:MAG TPA: hypothetical protein VFS39_17750 [Nitrospira sp.]|nr:hypothetical protein [Nitrospira sp.]